MVAEPFFDLIPADPTTPVFVPTNSVETGTINWPGDHDWFRIFMTAGENAGFDVIGQNGFGGTLSDPTLGVRDSFGAPIPGASNDDVVPGFNLNSHVNFNASYTGFYYLDVGGYAANTGSYTLFT
jgi:serralysin